MAGFGIFELLVLLFVLAFILAPIVGMWLIFTKAGRPGWLSIIPFVNLFVLVRVAGLQWWWFLLTLIPYIGIAVLFYVFLKLAAQFGQGVGFTLGLFFLSPIFFPILGFSDNQYQGQLAYQHA